MATTMRLIQKVTLSASANSVTFSSLDALPFTDLLLVSSARNTSTSDDSLNARFNSDSGSNYPKKFLYGTGSSVGNVGNTATYAHIGFTTLSNQTTSTFGSSESYIPNYQGSAYKSISYTGTEENNATTSHIVMGACTWNSTSGISSITLYTAGSVADFASGSSFFLYGITKA